MSHLGPRISDLLDGQLSFEEEERAWDHVHACHRCRDLVEREGWVKTQLAALSFGGADLPEHLRTSLSQPVGSGPRFAPSDTETEPRPRWVALAALGSGAAGAAVMGVLVLGSAPAQVPPVDTRVPSTSFNSPLAPVPAGTGRRDAGR